MSGDQVTCSCAKLDRSDPCSVSAVWVFHYTVASLSPQPSTLSPAMCAAAALPDLYQTIKPPAQLAAMPDQPTVKYLQSSK